MELYEAMSTLRAVRRLKTDPLPEHLATLLPAAREHYDHLHSRRLTA